MVSKRKVEKNDHGFVLITVLFLMLLIAVVAAGMNRRAGMGARMSANQLGSMQTYLGQRAAIEHTKWQLTQTPSWRTSSSGEDYIFSGVTYTRKALDIVIPCYGNSIEVSVAVAGSTKTINAFVPPSSTGSPGMTFFREGNSNFPWYAQYDGSSFGIKATSGASFGRSRIMAGAVAPAPGALSEILVFGINTLKQIKGTRWNGSAWNDDFGGVKQNETGVSENYWWGVDVAYEQQSGDAVLVWNNNTDTRMLQYRVWNGTAWSSATTIADYTGGEPQNIYLAAKPGADEMVVVVNDINADDYALVWSGYAWGNALLLDSSGTAESDQTALYVAYEQQSGNAMVVYGKDNDANAYYRIWNGFGWGLEGTITPPGGVTSQTRWLTMASDPSTNNIVLGVLTEGGNSDAVWFSIWDGTSWGAELLAEVTAASYVSPNVAVAFMTQSREALVTYGEGGQTVVRYRKWNSCTGWTGDLAGPDIVAVPNTMMLESDPVSNNVMLSVQNAASKVYYAQWNGSSWGTPMLPEPIASGETQNQPFIFLFDQP